MSHARDLIKRLEELNHGPLRYGDRIAERAEELDPLPPVRTETVEVIRYRVVPQINITTPAPRSPSKPMRLEDAIQGAEIIVPERGQAYRITTEISDLPEERGRVGGRLHEALSREDSCLQTRISLRCPGSQYLPEDLLFFDLETTGLSHTPLFLIGVMTCEGGDLLIRQYLARHYAEEAAVTAMFLEHASEKQLLVSYNGKSFDLPYVRSRAIANRIPFQLEIPHFDLLHESRRVWRGTVPNCRLQTLECCVCEHPPRYGDIPGAAIPDAYHNFVRTGDAIEIVRILEHNMLDLVTMAEIMLKLPPLEEPQK